MLNIGASMLGVLRLVVVVRLNVVNSDSMFLSSQTEVRDA